MEEKEERISVIVYEKDPCENCPGNPMKDCQVCEKDLRYDGSITHQEAIRKMCDAYFKAKDKGLMESERVVAALNALLETK